MPKIRRKRTKFPEDWEVVEETLLELEEKMRDAENAPHGGKKVNEVMWPIFKIHHQRTRYIYEMYYRKSEISKECYDFCLREKYADANLIAKWKKDGYERLCCLHCIQTRDHGYGTTCICRVPKDRLDSKTVVECSHCGCRGCASCD